MAGESRKRLLRLAVSLLIAGGFLALVVRGLEWREVGEVLRTSRTELLVPVLVLLVAHYALKGLRWRALLAEEIEVPRLLAVRLVFVGFLMNNFLPARAGELGRPYLLTANVPGARFSFALATMLGVKLFDLLAVVLCLLASALVLELPPFAHTGIILLSVASLIAMGTGVLAARWVGADRDEAGGRREGEGRLYALLERVLGGRAPQVYETAQHFAAGLATMSRPRAFLAASAYTAGSFVLLAVALVLCMEMVHVDAGLEHTVFVMGMIGIGFTIPAPPTGAGNYHWFASQALLLTGVASPEAAFGFALVAHLTQVVANSAGGLLSLVGLDWKKR
jgi:glycosyltransferase 2 family protein